MSAFPAQRYAFPQGCIIDTRADFAGHWPLLRAVLEVAPRKLTRVEIGQLWPAARRDLLSRMQRE